MRSYEIDKRIVQTQIQFDEHGHATIEGELEFDESTIMEH